MQQVSTSLTNNNPQLLISSLVSFAQKKENSQVLFCIEP
jgi:hypothetical protein